MTTTMNASNPHDIFFKASMRDLRIAKDFFAAHLPTDILPYAKLDTLELISSSFIDEQMQETHSDLIYRLIIGSEQAYIYLLLEHQSSPDRLLPFRLAHYKFSLMSQHLKQGNETLPLIIPLCLYHGRQSPYPYSIELGDLFAQKELAKQYSFEKMHLIDLTVVSLEELEKSGMAYLMCSLLKISRARDFRKQFEELVNGKVYYLCISKCDTMYMGQILYYCSGAAEKANAASREIIQLCVEGFPVEKKEETMHYLEQLEYQGYKKGLQEGKQEGIQEGLQEGVSKMIRTLSIHGMKDHQISEYTGFSLEKIQEIRTRKSDF